MRKLVIKNQDEMMGSS